MTADPGLSDPETLTRHLGGRLREAREEAGLSGRELARRVGVSASLLSQVENGLARPSVGTLWAIVTELGLSLDSVFSQDGGTSDASGHNGPNAAHVQRSTERDVIALEGGVRWERLTPGPDADADFAFVTYQPGADAGGEHPPARHSGKEYGFVVAGRLAVEVGEQELELGPGDSIVFGSETPHRFRALDDEPAQAVWINIARPG